MPSTLLAGRYGLERSGRSLKPRKCGGLKSIFLPSRYFESTEQNAVLEPIFTDLSAYADFDDSGRLDAIVTI